MEITLRHLPAETWPRPEGWTVVGTVDGAALAYDAERRPHALADGGPVPLDRDAVNAALAPAVDAAASRLWPGGWVHAVADVFQVNKRMLATDRIARQGLPPGLLRALAFASHEHDADGIGQLMGALAHYVDRHADGDPEQCFAQAEEAARNAIANLRLARTGKPQILRNRNTWV